MWLWWGDAAAAAFISLEIVRDGWHNIRQVVGDLMDEAPTVMDQRDLEVLPTKLREAAARLPWIGRAAVRLRELGRVLTGEVFVVPRPGTADLVGQVGRANVRSLTGTLWDKTHDGICSLHTL
jgi:divalent metal cation (Fe/Co/Zn/Cd) transporter